MTSQESYSQIVDMWSVGCIVYFMLCRRPAFHGKDDDETDELVSNVSYQWPDDITVSDEGIYMLHMCFTNFS